MEKKKSKKDVKGLSQTLANENPGFSYTYKFFWYFLNQEDLEWRPDVREGHTLTTCGKYLVLYGGISFNLIERISFYDPGK